MYEHSETDSIFCELASAGRAILTGGTLDDEERKKRMWTRFLAQPFSYVWLLRDAAGSPPSPDSRPPAPRPADAAAARVLGRLLDVLERTGEARRGLELARHCQDMLARAQQQVTMLEERFARNPEQDEPGA